MIVSNKARWCLPDWHMTVSTVRRCDGRWHHYLQIWGSTVASAASHCCSDTNLQLSHPAEETVSHTTDIHPCARFKSILFSAPHFRNLALFSLIYTKQHWQTSHTSYDKKTVIVCISLELYWYWYQYWYQYSFLMILILVLILQHVILCKNHKGFTRC